ncbi:MAG TPA: hypothetical protein PLV53_01810 [Anaerolineaceae bacterium]|jgi:hypothetical protein|nr:hypothetical protein [Anaerolineaceae bacterium]
MTQVTPTTDVLHCYVHPNRETMLRCNRCDRPICSQCAVQTPTGYRCRECVRGQQRTFDTSKPQDYVFGALVAGVLGLAGSFLAGFLGIFTLFVAPVVGAIIAEAVRFVVRRRRSKLLFQVATGAAVIGALARPVYFLLLAGAGFSLLWGALFAALMASSLYYRLSGIRILR